jgi:hypothetical protein
MGGLGLFLTVAAGIFGLIGAIYWYQASRRSRGNRIGQSLPASGNFGNRDAICKLFTEPAEPTFQQAVSKNSPNISSGGGFVVIGHIATL